MPTEKSDKTRVNTPTLVMRPQTRPQQQTRVVSPPPAQLWDKDKVDQYTRMQDFTNNNYWNYGSQTNVDPHTAQGQAAIESNFNYAKGNMINASETLLTTGVTEGIGQAVKWATTPKEIGRGAEAVVKSAPVSTTVTKTTTIPVAEAHIRNTVPGAAKLTYKGTSNGLAKYTQPKVKILTTDQVTKAAKSLEKLMNKKGWRKITHPNLQGMGFTNGKFVISDLKPGNIGRDWLGRIRLPDFAIETPTQFRLAMQKRGGKLINKN